MSLEDKGSLLSQSRVDRFKAALDRVFPAILTLAPYLQEFAVEVPGFNPLAWRATGYNQSPGIGMEMRWRSARLNS